MKAKYTASEYPTEEKERLESLYASTFCEESKRSGYRGKDIINNQAIKISIANLNRDKNIAMGETSTGQSVFIDLIKEQKGFKKLGHPAFTIEEGMELDVIVKKSNNGDITGSISAGYELTLKRELHRAIKEQDCAYSVRIKELCNGGFMVELSGIICFLPGSLAAANRILNFSEYVGKETTVMIETYDQRRDIFVVSFKKYLKKVINEKVKELSLTFEYEGKVTGASGKGVFVEWNELYTGIINYNSVNEKELKDLNPGDGIKFYVHDIKNPNRIILNMTQPTEKSKNIQDMKNSSHEILGETEDSKIYMGEITKIKTFGAFVKLDNGLTGLIEKEKLVDPIGKYEIGQEVACQVSSVDVSSLKIQLTEKE